MKKSLLTPILCIGVVLLGCNQSGNKISKDEEFIRKSIEKASAQQNLPRMINSEWRADRISLVGSRSLVYSRTLVHVEKRAFDVKGFAEKYIPDTLEDIENASGNVRRMLNEYGVTMHFAYYDRNGEFLCDMKFNRDGLVGVDYQNEPVGDD